MIGNLPYGKKKKHISLLSLRWWEIVELGLFLGLLVLIRGLERTVKE